jgi:HD superfamily phosphohydrolase
MAAETEWRAPSSPKAVFFILLGVAAFVRALQLYDKQNEEALRRFQVARQEEALRKSLPLTEEQFRRIQEVRPLHPADVYELRRERWAGLGQGLSRWFKPRSEDASPRAAATTASPSIAETGHQQRDSDLSA